MKGKHPRVILAFGTDTDFFNSLVPFGQQPEPKMFDAFYPATFSDNWKRQQLFAEALKDYRGLACGVLQPDGIEGYKLCKENGIYTMIGLVPTILILNYIICQRPLLLQVGMVANDLLLKLWRVMYL